MKCQCGKKMFDVVVGHGVKTEKAKACTCGTTLYSEELKPKK